MPSFGCEIILWKGGKNQPPSPQLKREHSSGRRENITGVKKLNNFLIFYISAWKVKVAIYIKKTPYKISNRYLDSIRRNIYFSVRNWIPCQPASYKRMQLMFQIGLTIFLITFTVLIIMLQKFRHHGKSPIKISIRCIDLLWRNQGFTGNIYLT